VRNVERSIRSHSGRGEETRIHGVVEAFADCSHRWPQTRLTASLAELDRRLLTTLIGVINDNYRISLRDAIFNAAVTSDVQRCVAMDQPTIFRLEQPPLIELRPL